MKQGRSYDLFDPLQNFQKIFSPTMVGRRESFSVLEALKTPYTGF